MFVEAGDLLRDFYHKKKARYSTEIPGFPRLLLKNHIETDGP